MSASPFVSINPAMRSGAPCINGIRVPVSAVAGTVLGYGVAEAMSSYDLTRHDVLVACWYVGTYGVDDVSWRGDGKPQRLHRGPSKGGGWRGLWGQWAADVSGALWNVTTLDLDAIPDPPTREDHP